MRRTTTIKTNLLREAGALKRTFLKSEGNSNRKKRVFQGVALLWGLGAVGLMTGLYAPDPELFKLFTAIVLGTGLRIWGEEAERLRHQEEE